jgi:hypothetical protein
MGVIVATVRQVTPAPKFVARLLRSRADLGGSVSQLLHAEAPGGGRQAPGRVAAQHLEESYCAWRARPVMVNGWLLRSVHLVAALVLCGIVLAVTFGINISERARWAVDRDHITDLAHVRDRFEAPWGAWNMCGRCSRPATVGTLARAPSCMVGPPSGTIAIVDHIERGGWQADALSLSVPGGVRGCDSRRDDAVCLRAAVRPRRKAVALLTLRLGRWSADRVGRPDDHRAVECRPR